MKFCEWSSMECACGFMESFREVFAYAGGKNVSKEQDI